MRHECRNRFVAEDRIENTVRSYKRLGSIVNDGRLAGLIDWSAIEDRDEGVIYEIEENWSSGEIAVFEAAIAPPASWSSRCDTSAVTADVFS